MPYLIDSDVLIAHREGDPDAADLLARLAPAGLAISIITYMEVYQGTLRSPDPDRAQAKLAVFLAGVPVVPFSLAAAQRCTALREDLNCQGKRVRSRALDLMTAAIALEHGSTLVTRNRADYADIPDLRLADL
jgi:predicted nucleic acid-binding protein